MTILASVEDVAARLGRPVLDDERPRLQAFIEDASAFVVDYCTGAWDRTSPPATFKAVVCAEVIRWVAIAPGVVLERTGELEVQFGATASTQGLSQAAKDALRRYRRNLATIPLSTAQEPPCAITPSE